MSVNTRPTGLKGIIQALKQLGNSEVINDNNQEVVILDPALIEALEKVENGKLLKETTSPISSKGGSKKGKLNSNMKKKYEAPTMEVKEMSSEKLEEMRKILEGKELEEK